MYTLQRAADATGKDASTLARAIKKGTISAQKDEQGRYVIDPSELHRVYPPIASHGNATINATDMEKALQAVEIAHLQALLREKEERLVELRQDRDIWRGQAERMTLLLSPLQTPAPARRRWSWPWQKSN